jgi:hypothetical protein
VLDPRFADYRINNTPLTALTPRPVSWIMGFAPG